MIHTTLSDTGRKITFTSFVAFERSMESGPESSMNRGKSRVQRMTKNDPTEEGNHDIEVFEGARTRRHEFIRPPETYLVVPRENKSLKVKAIR